MKDFKIAHIVSRDCLELIERNHYHMCLAHLVYEEARNDDVDWATMDNRYTKFYRRMSDEGKFVLMDNGAAEGSQLQIGDLLDMYELVKPTEIVVPDTLNDSVDTLKKMERFVSRYADLPYRFMGVPQGKNLQEWVDCMFEMLGCTRINSIGISKFLNISTGIDTIRLDAASITQTLANVRGRRDIEIHLLGCDEGPAIVKRIQETVPMVRGCDSAFAYIAAQAGVGIGNGTKRPKGEIDFLNGAEPDGLVYRLKEMEYVAGAGQNTNGDLWRGKK